MHVSLEKHHEISFIGKVVSLENHVVLERTVISKYFMEFFPDPVKVLVIIISYEPVCCYVCHHGQ